MLYGMNSDERSKVTNVLHVMEYSENIFMMVQRLLKYNNAGQLMWFLRKLRKILRSLQPGNAILIPAFVENSEMLLFVQRKQNQSYFRFVVISTDPDGGLRHHDISAAKGPGFSKLKFRCSMVLDFVPKNNALDDVFWMALFNMSIKRNSGDCKKFYDVLIPFLIGKPLEEAIISAEKAEANYMKGDHLDGGSFGDWRSPQRSATSYVRCLSEAIHYMLRAMGLNGYHVKRVGLALKTQFVRFLKSDLDHMHPDENGIKVIQMATSQLSYTAVKLAGRKEKKDDEIKKSKEETTELKETDTTDDTRSDGGDGWLETVRILVDEVNLKIQASIDQTDNAPPALDLKGLSKMKSQLSKTIKKAQSTLKQDSSKFVPYIKGKDGDFFKFNKRTPQEKAKEKEMEEMRAKYDNSDDNDDDDEDHDDDTNETKTPSINVKDQAMMQWADMLAWELEQVTPDPGQAEPQPKYIPVDPTMIPRRCYTREEAIDALSTCSKTHGTIRGLRLPSTNNSVCSQHLAISVLSTWYR
jgi:hypothetical protein